ncbi:beta-lactamase domain-containing protein 2-like [Mercenaria mercenaria]|uniref:beta-lactamase domain-containing protein 2-like n=1 Tax=Mercenaria mercenaria TaxID=6596 RepID=UPI00234E9B4B|nr:beta-lactamase domain-containing protein 2-like [Mercenaria mercenaria]
MGFVKQSVIFCILIILYTYTSTLLEPKLPVNVDGYVHPAFKRVADVFRENVELDRNPGIAFAVYHRGELLVDMWGGDADLEAQIPWSRDTIALAYSVSKGVAAIVVAKMVEKGHLDYARPVAKYWPEFAQQEKGNITVEMLLSHQAGLVTLDEPIHVRDIKDNPEKVDKILARQKTSWLAGTNFGYHSLSSGPYVDTLVKKADPKGRDIVQIFKEDIADVHVCLYAQ